MKRAPSWKVGDRVELVRDYELPVPAEILAVPKVPAGTRGTVVRKTAETVWVQMVGYTTPLTFWTADAFPERFAKTTLLKRAQ